MKIALAQVNPVIGDLEGNAKRIVVFNQEAERQGAALVIYPELAVTGYPPKDLLLKQRFIEDNLAIVRGLAAELSIPAIVGYVEREGESLYNAAGLLQGGVIRSKQYKTCLPTYDVFDEARYFERARSSDVIQFEGRSLGIEICEDLWDDGYPIKVSEQLSRKGAEVLVNISASPFCVGKIEERRELVAEKARICGIPFLYVNQVGGQDDLVFDGRSLVADSNGEIVMQAKGFEEDLVLVDLEALPRATEWSFDAMADLYGGLVLGLRDYVRKSGFTNVVIGLSGGIDSSLTAVLAAHALGGDAVLGVTMPGAYSSRSSLEDAEALAEALDVTVENIPIDPLFDGYRTSLKPLFRDLPEDVAEENLQARIRGTLLMAISNKLGRLLLTTGNKSELSVGYSTLYGDMAGGFAVLSDVPKTTVYELSVWINEHHGAPIPPSVLKKAPSAELRPDQTDQDSLPPYEALDPVLEAIIEDHRSRDEIIAEGFAPELVDAVIRMIVQNEFKRIQMPLGIRVTSKAFGSGRRMPVINRYLK